jgi:hypothetical protein
VQKTPHLRGTIMVNILSVKLHFSPQYLHLQLFAPIHMKPYAIQFNNVLGVISDFLVASRALVMIFMAIDDG